MGRKFVPVPVPMLWFWTSSQNIHKIIKSSNLSFEMSDDTGHNLSRRFIDFRKQYEQNIYGKGIFLLQHLGCVINLKCMLDPVREIEFLELIVNFQTMTLSLPEEKIVKIKDQCLSFYKASEVSLLGLTNIIGTLSWTTQAVLPTRLQFRFLHQQQILSLKQTQSYLTLVKLTPMAKNEFL